MITLKKDHSLKDLFINIKFFLNIKRSHNQKLSLFILENIYILNIF